MLTRCVRKCYRESKTKSLTLGLRDVVRKPEEQKSPKYKVAPRQLKVGSGGIHKLVRKDHPAPRDDLPI